MLPELFKTRIKADFDEKEATTLLESLEQPATISIRLNPKKTTILPAHYTQNPVFWCKEGFYLAQRPIFTLDANFWAGAYYVQEASSMFLGEVLEQILPNNLDKNPVCVLDLCAAPGGKSTHISTIIGEKSFLVSNEVIKARLGILEENMTRWGNTNYALTSNDAETFGRLEGFFDIVVVDAPCSGEGMFRKEENALREWSEANVQICSARQKRILADIAPSIKQGGYLVYSTCTFNRQENEENLHFLVNEMGFSCVALDLSNIQTTPNFKGEKQSFPTFQGGVRGGYENDFNIQETREKNLKGEVIGYHFYPHKTQGEGFFVAVLQRNTFTEGIKFRRQKSRYEELNKKDLAFVRNWLNNADSFSLFSVNKTLVFAVPKMHEEKFKNLDGYLFMKNFGTLIGEIKGKDFIPSHELAMCDLLAPASADTPTYTRMALSHEQALDFLRKQPFELDKSQENNTFGWTLATYQNLPLGWFKRLSGRINNYYPNNIRIKNL